jgi:hypothetical protein
MGYWLTAEATPPLWPESNVTLDYLSTLNSWAKRFNFSINCRPSISQRRGVGSHRQRQRYFRELMS